MMQGKKTPITTLLQAWRQGDMDAFHQLTPLVYDELHRVAAAYMRRERQNHTFTPTALVSEAFLRLSGGEPSEAVDRVRFFSLAAQHMRSILVDHARRRTASKRGGKNKPITFDEALAPNERPEEIIALDEALQALAKFDERKAQIVELHYFGGMGYVDIATALALSETTVGREVRTAQAWLHRHLTSAD
jgi:RNA polymerase sigma factor (TIGR02999 family)